MTKVVHQGPILSMEYWFVVNTLYANTLAILIGRSHFFTLKSTQEY